LPVAELFDVAVVGGGPSGCLVACVLASSGWRVVLLERRLAGEVEPCCTGIVGRPYLDRVPAADDLVLASARSAVLISPSNRRLHVAASEDQAFVLNRALLERLLRRDAVRAGVQLLEGDLVTCVHVARDVCETRVAGRDGVRTVLSRALVIAAGVSPGLLHQSRLECPPRHMVGAHAEVEMDGVDETEVYFLSDVAPGAFAWLAPTGPHTVRLGVLSHTSAAEVTRRFLERPAVRSRLRQRVTSVLQRPVPVALSARMHAARVLAVGDAAGQVKPTTGGGLYLGAMGADAAAAVLSDALTKDDLCAKRLSSYDARWRSTYGGELRRGAFARAAYVRLSARQVDRIVHTAERSGVGERLLRSPSFSFDRHSGALLSGLLRCLPGALLLSLSGRSEAQS